MRSRWTGAAGDSDFSNPANWDNGHVPESVDEYEHVPQNNLMWGLVTLMTFTISLEGYPTDTITVSEPGHAGFREAAWDAYKSKHLRDEHGQRVPCKSVPIIEEVK